MLAAGIHPVTFRTRQLSLLTPTILGFVPGKQAVAKLFFFCVSPQLSRSEHLTVNQRAVGSSPTGDAIFFCKISQEFKAERHEALYSMSMNRAAVNMRAAGCCGEYGKLGQGSFGRKGLRRSCLFLFSRKQIYVVEGLSKRMEISKRKNKWQSKCSQEFPVYSNLSKKTENCRKQKCKFTLIKW